MLKFLKKKKGEILYLSSALRLPRGKCVIRSLPPPGLAIECYSDSLGQDYRGFVNVTNTGLTCQRWTRQSPHEHIRTAEGYPGMGLGDHNYCRNPDAEPDGPWCYTLDADIRWQYCSVGEPHQHCSGMLVMLLWIVICLFFSP